MTTQSAFDQSADGSALVCAIPGDGTNAPRALAVDDDGLPVILRDPMPSLGEWEAFGCKVRSGTPATPDRVPADVTFHRQVHSGARVTMPDGVVVEFYGFFDPTKGENKEFPSPPIRVIEGQVVHTTLVSDKNTHTIHHHGINPTPHNDGVGHTSFEVAQGGSYTYQWKPKRAGLHFYHCHKNTALHFELGMYGALIVDPPGGKGYVRVERDIVAVDQEALWIVDDVDPAWHHIHHKAGLECPWDDSQPLLHFEPTYFVLSGVPHPRSRTDRRVAVTCARGDLVLLRLLNAAYGPVEVRLPFDATVIAKDGHTLGDEQDRRYSRSYAIPAGRPFTLVTSQRWDVLVQPAETGTFVVEMDVKHWVRNQPHGRVETTVTVR